MAPVSQIGGFATVPLVTAPPRISLANLPTPLERAERLQAAWGGPEIWVKRDDLTGFGLSGNKVRKLEYHLRAALDSGATTVITCGAVQSNHCRATALATARLGLRCILYLRSPDGGPPDDVGGNHLLQRLAGAECRFITPEEYADRDRLMAAAAQQIGDAWVIPEGASDPLGMWGFATAVEELHAQLHAEGLTGAAIWHAAMSAGTTAGFVWGVERLGLEELEIIGCSVGDSSQEIAGRVDAILTEARSRYDHPETSFTYEITDAYVGEGYGLATARELALQEAATQRTGLLFDPAYTGKALVGLHEEIRRGRFGAKDTVVFWHTGGGFAVFAHDWPGLG